MSFRNCQSVKRGALAITIPSKNYNLTTDVLGKIFTSRHSRWVAKHSRTLGLLANDVKIKGLGYIHSFTPKVIIGLLEKGDFSVILFKNAYFIANLIMALLLGFFGLKRRHIKGLLKLDLKLAEKVPSTIAGGYVVIARGE
jgi:hypothetical protein